MTCFHRHLGISYRDHVTNEVRNTTRHAIGPYEDLITTEKRRIEMEWAHKRSRGLAKIKLLNLVLGGRRKGRQKKKIGR